MNPPDRSHDNAFVNTLCTSASFMYMNRPPENIRSQLQRHNAQRKSNSCDATVRCVDVFNYSFFRATTGCFIKKALFFFYNSVEWWSVCMKFSHQM